MEHQRPWHRGLHIKKKHHNYYFAVDNCYINTTVYLNFVLIDKNLCKLGVVFILTVSRLNSMLLFKERLITATPGTCDWSHTPPATIRLLSITWAEWEYLEHNTFYYILLL